MRRSEDGMELKIHTNELKNLRETCFNYLKDAGFLEGMCELVENEEKKCIEVFFHVDEAIDYVVEDIEKTEWSKIIRVKKYCFYDKYRALFYEK